ncbi:MAG TPA: hypothetical protein VI997_09620 [Candidatus Thermoplasmatota archaeon]|nr:hypothetical protein [Candidatus Thermoplasmatota archaeon]
MTTKKKHGAKGDDEVPRLTLGSKFRIRSLGSRDQVIETVGEFRGVTSIGSVDALAIEVEGEKKLRIIPSHMLLAVDVIELAEDEEEKESGDVHYG